MKTQILDFGTSQIQLLSIRCRIKPFLFSGFDLIGNRHGKSFGIGFPPVLKDVARRPFFYECIRFASGIENLPNKVLEI